MPAGAGRRRRAAARRARGGRACRVDAVAQQLKLAPRQVKALEDGDFGVLPGRTFMRGFLRNYARLVHLDPDAVLVRICPRGAAPRRSSRRRCTRRRRRWASCRRRAAHAAELDALGDPADAGRLHRRRRAATSGYARPRPRRPPPKRRRARRHRAARRTRRPRRCRTRSPRRRRCPTRTLPHPRPAGHAPAGAGAACTAHRRPRRSRRRKPPPAAAVPDRPTRSLVVLAYAGPVVDRDQAIAPATC